MGLRGNARRHQQNSKLLQAFPPVHRKFPTVFFLRVYSPSHLSQGGDYRWMNFLFFGSTLGLFRSTASGYCVRSLEPTA